MRHANVPPITTWQYPIWVAALAVDDGDPQVLLIDPGQGLGVLVLRTPAQVNEYHRTGPEAQALGAPGQPAVKELRSLRAFYQFLTVELKLLGAEMVYLWESLPSPKETEPCQP